METKVTRINRKSTGWEFRATETLTKINGSRLTNIVYGMSYSYGAIPVVSIELYRGPNYLVNGTGGNWSRKYDNIESMPVQFQDIAKELELHHTTTNWLLFWERQEQSKNKS